MKARIEAVSAGMAELLAAPLARLHRRCFPDDPWSARAVAEILAIAGCFGALAVEDGEPTGLALAQGLGQECEVLTLGVAPELRRAGIGSALLEAVIAEARRRSARTMFLEVADDNIAARALYASRGFAQINRRPYYYRRRTGPVDALVLRLLLST